MRSTTRLAALAAALLLVLGAVTAAASAAANRGPCANHLCTKYKPHTTSCWDKHGRRKIARCFIARAATHFRQSKSKAFHIAWKESRYDWHATNRSSGAAGLYQFMSHTWHTTPYRKHSRYHPRWAALAAMWMWKHGGYHHWQ
jgi:soluble lytic murein transglycosylase-like protein